MNLVGLAYTKHPRPPQRELRQMGSFDSVGALIGSVANIYVDDGSFRFVDIVMVGFLGFGKKHHLVPIAAIDEGDPGSITLTVDRQTAESAATLGDLHTTPDEDLQRAARESGAKNSGRWGVWE